MSSARTAPYGEWVSPVSADMLTVAARRLEAPDLVGGEIWWAEGRPAESGRTTVMAQRGDGTLDELVPAPWNVRSRVHEYGGRSWLAVPVPDGHALVFAHFDDQRLYRLDPGVSEPVPLTPDPQLPAGLRYADLVLAPSGVEVLAVRERHGGGDLDRHIVAVPLDGRHADDPDSAREVVGGSRFLAGPRLSPDGRRLAWLAWDHPRMPWDGTELRVGELDAHGRVHGWAVVLGGTAESVFQPEWASEEELYAASDRTGWWNLYRVPAAGGEPVALRPAAEEFGAPLWQLGMATYGLLADGRLLCIHGQHIGILDPADGSLADLELPFDVFGASLRVEGADAVVVAGSGTTPLSVVRLSAESGAHQVVRRAMDAEQLPDPAYLPVPETRTFTGPGGREVHAHVYPPANPDYDGPVGALPPYVVFVHGGPTANSPAIVDLGKAYFTSRGIGVVDVDYGGSTGYGRTYRERLQGAWGIVDVEDCVAAARALADAGLADGERLAIRGGSAGGWTALCAVTSTEVFAAGMSYCGVSDALRLTEITHDFESRYLDGLIGGGERLSSVARERSPLTHAGRTHCPVLLLQGADDPIVPLEQAEQFRDALAERGLRHGLVVFEGEQHGFRRADSIRAAAEAELSFYGQVMGFSPPDVPRVQLT